MTNSHQHSLKVHYIRLIHVHTHPCGHTHTCVHGHVCGWLRVYLHSWMAVCMIACMDDCVYRSLRVWLCARTGSEWEIFSKWAIVESWKLLVLTLSPVCTRNHARSDLYMQSSMHAKMHAAIHACENTCSHPHMWPCMQVCTQAREWLCGWMSTWIKLLSVTYYDSVTSMLL